MKLPSLLLDFDQRVTNGRVYGSAAETARFVMNERHPSVLVGHFLDVLEWQLSLLYLYLAGSKWHVV